MVRRRRSGLLIAWLSSMLLIGCYSGSPVKLELVAPALLFPSDGMKLVPDTLTLTWNSSGWETSFVVQVSTDINFSTLVDSAIITTSSRPIKEPLVNNMTYYWRVSSAAGPQVSEWSSIFSFTIGVAPPMPLGPEDNAIWIPQTPTLIWSALPGATKYYVQVSNDTVFSTAAVNDSSDSASFTIASPLTQSTTYYWRVAVVKPQGLSGWSETHEFTTVDSLPAPALLYPADNAVNVSRANDSLKWSGVPSDWASYHVQVSTASDFSANVVMDTTVMELTAPVNSLSGATHYYWRVAARLYLEGFMDRQGDWSASRSFMTQ